MLRFIDWSGGHEMSLAERGLRGLYSVDAPCLNTCLLAFMRGRIVCM